MLEILAYCHLKVAQQIFIHIFLVKEIFLKEVIFITVYSTEREAATAVYSFGDNLSKTIFKFGTNFY